MLITESEMKSLKKVKNVATTTTKFITEISRTVCCSIISTDVCGQIEHCDFVVIEFI